GLLTLSPLDCAPSVGLSCAKAALMEMASPRHITSNVRSRRAHRDLCCHLILGHPANGKRVATSSAGCTPLAASMWDAGAVVPCQCVTYFTHLKAKLTQPRPCASWPAAPPRSVMNSRRFN